MRHWQLGGVAMLVPLSLHSQDVFSQDRHSKNTESSHLARLRLGKHISGSTSCQLRMPLQGVRVGNPWLIRSHEKRTATCVTRQSSWRVYTLLSREGVL